MSSPPNPPEPPTPPQADGPRSDGLQPDAVFPPSGPAEAPNFAFAQPPRPQHDPPWSIWDVLRIALIAFLAIVMFSFVGLVVMRLATGHAPTAEEVGRNPRLVIPAQAAAYLTVILFMFLVVTRGYDRPFLRGVHWNFPARRWPAFLAGGVLLAVAVQLMSSVLPVPKQLPIDEYFRDYVGAWMMAVFGTLIAPPVEELFFRGFLYPVTRRVGVLFGLATTSLLFALIHESQLAHAWAPLLMLFVVGMALTLTREKTDSVAASVLVHVGYNGTLFALVWVASDHFRHLERLK